jgi:hypothetical protein
MTCPLICNDNIYTRRIELAKPCASKIVQTRGVKALSKAAAKKIAQNM